MVAGIFSFDTLAAEQPVMSIDADCTMSDDKGTLTVSINITDNPGVAMLGIQVSYDSSALVMTAMEDNRLVGDVYTARDYIGKNPLSLVWPRDIPSSVKGTLVILKFAVKDPGRAVDSLVFTVTDCFNSKYEDIRAIITKKGVVAGCQHINTVKTDGIPGTCLKYGISEGVYCNDCGTYISGHKETGVFGDHRYSGIFGFTCLECGHLRIELIMVYILILAAIFTFVLIFTIIRARKRRF